MLKMDGGGDAASLKEVNENGLVKDEKEEEEEEVNGYRYDKSLDLRRRGSHRQNGVIQPLLTDLYQITMAYAYWKADKTKDVAVFDLFFRKNPFRGEFTIFAGLEEVLKFLENFHYSESGKH